MPPGRPSAISTPSSVSAATRTVPSCTSVPPPAPWAVPGTTVASAGTVPCASTSTRGG
ncbi:hypothetical protein RLOC_00001694 [Lonchura striata]|uniref:Uncharacterized protein n=1 Tax=Lonchura striata TaxID=40157 RepID=A0A218UL54_9PASE|nr:hypothetical protein RLOC_00001694 [Lonchura striata domestica]